MSKLAEIKYRGYLLSIVSSLRKETESTILPILRSCESEYVNDSYAITLQTAFENLRAMFNNVAPRAKLISSSFVETTDKVNKERFYKAIEKSIGVNMQSIVSRENLEDILLSSVNENVALIRSIPETYFKTIEQIVYRETIQGSTSKSLIEQIQSVGKVTANRAKLIARDQTSKLNSALNQQRQQNLGVEEYIWRTAEDDRVRDSHAANNGKVYRWDNPPKGTGHPGQDIQCRCVAQPIINI